MTYLMSISHKEYQTITFSINERDTKNTSNNCDAKKLCDTHLKDVYGRICTLAAHIRENLVQNSKIAPVSGEFADSKCTSTLNVCVCVCERERERERESHLQAGCTDKQEQVSEGGAEEVDKTSTRGAGRCTA